MVDRPDVELTIHDQRLLLIHHHRQQWYDLAALQIVSYHELHEQHRQQRRQLVNATPQAYQLLLRQQVDRLCERHQADQVTRDQLRVEQERAWMLLNAPSNRPPE